jgi:hypothetical protein
MPARPHLLVVRAPFYQDIIAELTRGATLALDAAGAGVRGRQRRGPVPPARPRMSKPNMRRHG